MGSGGAQRGIRELLAERQWDVIHRAGHPYLADSHVVLLWGFISALWLVLEWIGPAQPVS